jgi:hypothetical protein
VYGNATPYICKNNQIMKKFLLTALPIFMMLGIVSAKSVQPVKSITKKMIVIPPAEMLTNRGINISQPTDSLKLNLKGIHQVALSRVSLVATADQNIKNKKTLNPPTA